MKARDKAAIRILIEGVPILLFVGLVTNVPTFGWPTVIGGLILLAAATVVRRRVWPLKSVDSTEPSNVSEQVPRDTKFDTVVLFATIGITMMVGTWIALRLVK